MDLTPTPKGWTEPAPDHCPNGHLLAGNALVGWQWCLCGGHRTHYCRACEAMLYLPEWTVGCRSADFDDR